MQSPRSSAPWVCRRVLAVSSARVLDVLSALMIAGGIAVAWDYLKPPPVEYRTVSYSDRPVSVGDVLAVSYEVRRHRSCRDGVVKSRWLRARRDGEEVQLSYTTRDFGTFPLSEAPITRGFEPFLIELTIPDLEPGGWAYQPEVKCDGETLFPPPVFVTVE